MAMSWMPAAVAGQIVRGPLEFAGMVIDAWADGARVYWSFWGPLGEPAIGAVEMVAGMQRHYLAMLADAFDGVSPAS